MKKLYSLILLMLCSSIYSIYAQDRLIVKLKENHREAIAKRSLQKIFQEEGISSVQKAFPQHTNKKLKKGEVDLSRIYYLEISSNKSIQKVLQQLRKRDEVEYAEPEYLNQLTYVPSDTLNGSQWYLNAVFAFDAWNIETGDTNVVIAISDTGIDTAHNDLKANIAYNYDDPINGVDDDNDGYIDNFYGWNT